VRLPYPLLLQIEAQQLVEAETAQARELERGIAAAEVRRQQLTGHISAQWPAGWHHTTCRCVKQLQHSNQQQLRASHSQ
jgi:hypothetical protein